MAPRTALEMKRRARELRTSATAYVERLIEADAAKHPPA
jgi:hypothetical protein